MIKPEEKNDFLPNDWMSIRTRDVMCNFCRKMSPRQEKLNETLPVSVD